MKQSILVTGAAGFIGAAVARRLLKQGHQVITIDNLTTGFRDNIPEGVIFLEGGCEDEDVIEELRRYDLDGIFHIAGQSSGEISFDNPVYDLQTNTQSTLMLLKLALEKECKKFVYASSMSVYGDRLDGAVLESDNPIPKSFYGVGKLASEHYLRIYAEYGITTTALRLCNTYGPGQNLENMRQGMVSIFLKQALDDQHIHVKGSANRFRDMTYIEDVVDAFILAYNRTSSDYLCVNVTLNEKITVFRLIEEIKKNFAHKISAEYNGSTPGDQFGVYGDNRLIRNTLNWSPKYDLKNGIEKMVVWAKSLDHKTSES